MRLALNEAWHYQFLTYPNPAVGACLVDKNGSILAIEAHKEAGKPHAEILALKSAYFRLTKDERINKIDDAFSIHEFLSLNHNNLFRDCTLFVTLEPCNHYGKTPPCSLLLSKIGLKRVVIGTLDLYSKGGAEILKKSGIEVEIGMLKNECEILIEPFLRWREKRFILYKWAQRLNGTIDGGYISSFGSLELVHKIRSKIDLLLIGGNTIRVDRPRLDSRLVGLKPPNIGIYSRQKEFDKTIPLFSVQDREVKISDSLDELLADNRFIMVEGGISLLKVLSDKIDWYMCFISLSHKNGINLEIPFLLELLEERRSDKDILFYARRAK